MFFVYALFHCIRFLRIFARAPAVVSRVYPSLFYSSSSPCCWYDSSRNCDSCTSHTPVRKLFGLPSGFDSWRCSWELCEPFWWNGKILKRPRRYYARARPRHSDTWRFAGASRSKSCTNPSVFFENVVETSSVFFENVVETSPVCFENVVETSENITQDIQL